MTSTDLIRSVSELVELWEAGKIKCPIHFPGGNEEQLAEIFKEVHKDDYVFSTHRNLYHFLLHGGDFASFRRGVCGMESGLCRGRAGSMGTIDPSIRFYSSAIVGGLVNVAVGCAWGLKESGSERRVWCFVGDGVLDGGHFWEALCYAEGWDLPVTFVVEDNDRSTCTTSDARNGVGNRLGREWNNLRTHTTLSSKTKYYHYTPTYPHVGSGTYIQF